MGETEQLISMHATLVDTACASETKRQSVSVTSAALISVAAAWVASDKDFERIDLVLPLLILCSIWFVTVRYYQQLAKAKWEVIHEIEDKLAFQPFKREWTIYKERKHPFTFGPSTLEQIIPALIFLASAATGIAWVLSNCVGDC
jgi:hypothetical protein